jgi:hypothetical protein
LGSAIPPRRRGAASDIIKEALERAGSSSSIRSSHAHVVTRFEDWQAVAAVHGEYFGAIRAGQHDIMQVTRFIDPDWLIEFEADAVVE